VQLLLREGNGCEQPIPPSAGLAQNVLCRGITTKSRISAASSTAYDDDRSSVLLGWRRKAVNQGIDEARSGSEKPSGATPPDRRAVSSTRLGGVLRTHETWVASGWEIGRRADLHRADLHGVDLRSVVLSDADLHRADLHRAALRGADLGGADLHRADLHRADLRGADLRWADLHDADLHAADLRGSDLRDADLHRADLHDADLRDADLTDTDLRGANLRRARGLDHRQVRRARIDSATRLPLGLID
jgi:uncharacterized protein YjbI with pentapeptide repeats